MPIGGSADFILEGLFGSFDSVMIDGPPDLLAPFIPLDPEAVFFMVPVFAL